MAEELKVYGFCENKCRREVMAKESVEELIKTINENILELQQNLNTLNEALSETADDVSDVSNSLSNKADVNHSHGEVNAITFASAEPTDVPEGTIVMVYEE